MLIEALLDLVVEVLGETLFTIAGAVISAAFEEAISDENQSHRALAAIHVLMGAVAGVVSLLILTREMVAHLVIPGMSLILAPVARALCWSCWADGGFAAATCEWRSSRTGAVSASPSEWLWSDSRISRDRGPGFERCRESPKQRHVAG
jgi:hypothetical protein